MMKLEWGGRGTASDVGGCRSQLPRIGVNRRGKMIGSGAPRTRVDYVHHHSAANGDSPAGWVSLSKSRAGICQSEPKQSS